MPKGTVKLFLVGAAGKHVYFGLLRQAPLSAGKQGDQGQQDDQFFHAPNIQSSNFSGKISSIGKGFYFSPHNQRHVHPYFQIALLPAQSTYVDIYFAGAGAGYKKAQEIYPAMRSPKIMIEQIEELMKEQTI